MIPSPSDGLPIRFHEFAYRTPEEREEAAGLSNLERQELVESLLVPYPRFKDARRFVEKFHRPVDYGRHGRGMIGALLGDSRSGKSWVLKHYFTKHGDVAEENRIRRPVIYIESVGGMRPYDFAVRAYRALGFRSIPRVRTTTLQEMFIEALGYMGCELVIFNDVDNTLQTSQFYKTQLKLEFIKTILDSNTVNVLCAGRLGLMKILRAFPQIEGRGGLPYHNLEPYKYTLYQEREEFGLLLNSIDDRMPFNKKSGLGSAEYLPHFWHMSGGLIGKVMNTLQSAAFEAITDGSVCIERKHLVYAASLRAPMGQKFIYFHHKLNPVVFESDRKEEVGGKVSKFKRAKSTEAYDGIFDKR